MKKVVLLGLCLQMGFVGLEARNTFGNKNYQYIQETATTTSVNLTPKVGTKENMKTVEKSLPAGIQAVGSEAKNMNSAKDWAKTGEQSNVNANGVKLVSKNKLAFSIFYAASFLMFLVFISPAMKVVIKGAGILTHFPAKAIKTIFAH